MARLHAFALKGLDQLGQLAQRKPVHRRGSVLLNLRRRFFFDGSDDDVEPLSARGVQHQQGKASVPGDQTDSFRHRYWFPRILPDKLVRFA